VELEGGIPVRAMEYHNSRIVSVTDFFEGRPFMQFADLNLDGRMETLRFFRRPPGKQAPGSPGSGSIDPFELLDYPLEFERAGSDWDGDGIFEETEYVPKE
jgi:hypothetical protein